MKFMSIKRNSLQAKNLEKEINLPLPWERQPEEPWRNFNAFITYRDLMPTERNMDILSRMLGMTQSTLKRWSRQWAWDERLANYLDFRDSQTRRLQLELRQQMKDRHATMAVRFLEKVNSRLETIDPEEMDAKTLITWYEKAVKIELLSRGEPTENVKSENNTNVNVSGNISVGKMVVDDEKASSMACELLERMTLRDKSSGEIINIGNKEEGSEKEENQEDE